MSAVRFAILGTGFWSRFQLAAWGELPEVECVAVYNRTRRKAERLAEEFGVRAVYESAEALFDQEQLDFVDIITGVETHAHFVQTAAQRKVPVICQKPMGQSLKEAGEMVAACAGAGVPFYVHENWRWQGALRAVKAVIESGRLGTVVRGRIDYANSFPVFTNQPFLKELDQFILTDIGTHLLDVARFLWGEASELYCQTRRIHPEVKGEEVATVMMQMGGGVTVTCNMSYASKWEYDCFPETFVAVEGSAGGVTLGPDYILKVTTSSGSETLRVAPQSYPWADPGYAPIHASIVECNRNLLEALRGEGRAETTGEDNLKTLRLVFGAYESAAERKVLRLQ